MSARRKIAAIALAAAALLGAGAAASATLPSSYNAGAPATWYHG